MVSTDINLPPLKVSFVNTSQAISVPINLKPIKQISVYSSLFMIYVQQNVPEQRQREVSTRRSRAAKHNATQNSLTCMNM